MSVADEFSSPFEPRGNMQEWTAGRLFELAQETHRQHYDFANHLGKLWMAADGNLAGLYGHVSSSDYGTPQQNFFIELPGFGGDQRRSVTVTRTQGSPIVTERYFEGGWGELSQWEAERILETGQPLTPNAAYTKLQERPCRTIEGNEAMDLFAEIALRMGAFLSDVGFLKPDSLRDISQPPTGIWLSTKHQDEALPVCAVEFDNGRPSRDGLLKLAAGRLVSISVLFGTHNSNTEFGIDHKQLLLPGAMLMQGVYEAVSGYLLMAGVDYKMGQVAPEERARIHTAILDQVTTENLQVHPIL